MSGVDQSPSQRADSNAFAVIPAKAGIHGRQAVEQQRLWIPAFAGMTSGFELARGFGQQPL